MSHASDLDASGGLSALHQEQQAAERELQRRIDAEWEALDTKLAQRAIAFRADGATRLSLEFRLALRMAFRQTLRDGVLAAMSGAMAEKILQETEP